jgi:hypothetical protein
MVPLSGLDARTGSIGRGLHCIIKGGKLADSFIFTDFSIFRRGLSDMPTAGQQLPRLSVCLLSLTLLLGASLAQGTAMIFEVSILQNNVVLCLPLIAPLKLSIDWGDNSALQYFTATTQLCVNQFYGIGHTYAISGNYTIKLDRDSSLTGPWLTGFGNPAPAAYWNNAGVASTAQITRVITFGNLGISSLPAAFGGCKMLTHVPPSLPSTVRSLSHIFDSSNVNSANISLWNTAAVTSLEYAFFSAPVFNQPLNSWNVSSATTLALMFASAHLFNQPLSSWKFAPRANLNGMFYQALAFNQPIEMWDMSGIYYIASMFTGATSFNQPLNSWNTSRVIIVQALFNAASSFNQPLDRWDTSKCVISPRLC